MNLDYLINRRGRVLELTLQHLSLSATAVLIALLVISGLQLSLFAMWFDMESNKDLK